MEREAREEERIEEKDQKREAEQDTREAAPEPTLEMSGPAFPDFGPILPETEGPPARLATLTPVCYSGPIST